MKSGRGWGNPLLIAVTAGVVGMLVRGVIVTRPPPNSTLWDHHEYVQWGRQMVDHGILSIYDAPPPATPMWNYETHRPAKTVDFPQKPCNYPPLAVYLIYLEAVALRWVYGDLVSNTPIARVIYSLPSFAGDILTALGCFAIVRRFATVNAAVVVGAATFLLPPLILDSAWWLQTDAWVLTPAVWMVWALLSRRWALAGLLWGVALGLKTQAVLFAPLWLFVVLVNTQRWRIVAGSMTAVVMVGLVSLPFSLGRGTSWFEHSFINNLVFSYKQTTLKAFNVWYVDLLFSEDDDASLRLLGIEKDAWGKVLLGLGWLASAVVLLRRKLPASVRVLCFAALSLLMAVFLPTRVHERYIVLPLPFLICAAAWNRKLLWPLIPLIAAASFQITALQWLKAGAHQWGELQDQVDVRAQYETLRGQLPPEEFARLPTPDEKIAQARAEYLTNRWNTGDPYKEWALTLTSLAAFAGCVVVLLGSGGWPKSEVPASRRGFS